MKLVYGFWALLPIVLFFFSARGAVNKVARAKTKEYVRDYLQNGVFCVLTLALAIYIDQRYFDEFVISIFGDLANPDALRWLTYPLMLLLGSLLESKLKRRSAR